MRLNIKSAEVHNIAVKLIFSSLVLAGGIGLLVFSQLHNKSSNVAVAATNINGNTPVDVKTNWVATKLLAIKFANNPTLPPLPIGVSEWTNTFQQRQPDGTYVNKYTEVWSLPPDNNGVAGLPDCYHNFSNCYAGGKWNGKYLWSFSSSGNSYSDKINGIQTTDDRNFTTVVSLPVGDPSFHNTETNSCSPNSGGGLGTIGFPTGCTSQNNNGAVTTGPYGWAYGKVDNEKMVVPSTIGTLMPLQWTVSGYFQ